jgi:2-oxoglutarate ferredoxin oxidoreductase subunit delta
MSLQNSVKTGNGTMAKKAIQIDIDPKMCKGCHICISVCPHGVLEKAEVVDNRGFYLPIIVNLDACKVCRLCEMECPDFAISVTEEEN